MHRSDYASRRLLRYAAIAVTLYFPAMAYPAKAAEGDRPVVDEGPGDPTLVDVRAAIIAALRLGDTEAVAGYADDDIRLDFGGGAGRTEFLNRPKSGEGPGFGAEEYRAALEEALVFGGRFTGPDVFEAPYSFTEPMPADLDAYDAYFVLGADVPVYRARDGRWLLTVFIAGD